ncbi:MAG: lipid-A-disaccharide synthase [Paludibacteraceae bacterium]|nr:lipid-A-disaccharide synthase [Paludibacteraceae bacterium]
MKYYVIAGEASGDLHGSFLLRQLKRTDPQAQFRFWGGDLMAAEADGLVRHYRATSVMGFVGVLTHLPKILGNLRFCREDILSYAPDIVVLIDYPGFNLKIAEFVKKNTQIPVFYYIPPKIWAWKEHRVELIKRYVDRVLTIFPFEERFYARHGYDRVTYVGNPSVDSVAHAHPVDRAALRAQLGADGKRIVALLPGSRRQEILLSLPVLKQLRQEDFPDCLFVMAATSAVDPSLYGEVPFPLLFDRTYDLLQVADAALVNSGTATLETALFEVPQVVCYQLKAAWISFPVIYHLLLHIPHVSLVNILAGSGLVTELLGPSFNLRNTMRELKRILYDDAVRSAVLSGYRQLKSDLGTQVASESAARAVVDFLQHR